MAGTVRAAPGRRQAVGADDGACRGQRFSTSGPAAGQTKLPLEMPETGDEVVGRRDRAYMGGGRAGGGGEGGGGGGGGGGGRRPGEGQPVPVSVVEALADDPEGRRGRLRSTHTRWAGRVLLQPWPDQNRGPRRDKITGLLRPGGRASLSSSTWWRVARSGRGPARPEGDACSGRGSSEACHRAPATLSRRIRGARPNFEIECCRRSSLLPWLLFAATRSVTGVARGARALGAARCEAERHRLERRERREAVRAPTAGQGGMRRSGVGRLAQAVGDLRAGVAHARFAHRQDRRGRPGGMDQEKKHVGRTTGPKAFKRLGAGGDAR